MYYVFIIEKGVVSDFWFSFFLFVFVGLSGFEDFFFLVISFTIRFFREEILVGGLSIGGTTFRRVGGVGRVEGYGYF